MNRFFIYLKMVGRGRGRRRLVRVRRPVYISTIRRRRKKGGRRRRGT